MGCVLLPYIAPAVITMSGFIFQPRATMLSNNGLYLLVLASNVDGENLSLQYGNSINWIVTVWSIFVGGMFWYGNLLTHKMHGLKQKNKNIYFNLL